MTRKFLGTIQTEINTLLADNTSQDITAAELRQVVTDIMDSTYEMSAYVASTTVSNAFPVTATPQIVPMGTVVSKNADPLWMTASPANRQINVQAPAVGFGISVIFEATAEGPNNQRLEFAVFVNNLPTRWTAECTCQGAGRPASVSLSGLLVGEVGPIDLRVSSPTNANITFTSASIMASVRPTVVAL
jgi:hypothetical protein